MTQNERPNGPPESLQARRSGSFSFDEVYAGSPPWAIGLAEGKARDRGLSARFLVHDALDLGSLGERFETVLDSGLFHVFDDDDRLRYVDSLRAVTAPGA